MSSWLSNFLGSSHSKDTRKGDPRPPMDALEAAFEGLTPLYRVIFKAAQTGATIPVIAKRWSLSENAVKNILETTCLRLIGVNRIDLIPEGCLDLVKNMYLPDVNRSSQASFCDQQRSAIPQIIQEELEPPPVVVADRDGDAFRSLLISPRTKISFHRTLRVPEDGKDYPLPAGLGSLPIHRVEDYAHTVPSDWLNEGGFFIPLYQKEALFLQFEGLIWHPSIAKVCVGKINAISGKAYSERLSNSTQDYVVIPAQKWLDGISSGKGTVSQFVAMPLGQGYTIEAQITDEEKFGGFQIVAYDAVDGRFPDRDPAVDKRIQAQEQERLRRKQQAEGLKASPLPESSVSFSIGRAGAGTSLYSAPQVVSMGIAAGGSIKQQIQKDTYGVASWNPHKKRSLTIHLVNSMAYKAITGIDPPSSPITVATYERAKIPWFSHYDETVPAVKPPSVFKRILGISAIEKKRGITRPDDEVQRSIVIRNIHTIRTPDKHEASSNFRERAYESQSKEWWEAAIREISYVIDLQTDAGADDFALRSCCNYHIGRYSDGAIDGSLALEKDKRCVEALSWRAYCRKSLGDHEGLREDADELIKIPETELVGLELRAEASLLSGCYNDAIYDALSLKKKNPGHPRAEQILSEARSKAHQKFNDQCGK
jgi:hypothetical protein